MLILHLATAMAVKESSARPEKSALSSISYQRRHDDDDHDQRFAHGSLTVSEPLSQ
jgi:hypothetical protein